MKTVSIQGKPYITVNERLKEFRKADASLSDPFAGYSLESEWIKVDEQIAICRAVIRNQEGRLIATGTALERADSSFINRGSHVENCETSAWGRALGNLGIGIDASVATADEVANAVVNQKTPKKAPVKSGGATSNQLAEIGSLAAELGGSSQQVYDTWTGGLIPTFDQAVQILTQLHTKKKNLSKELDKTANSL